jgi:OOP family OmpA-OmpF porin
MYKSLALTLTLAATAAMSSATVSANDGFYVGPQLGYYYLDDKRSIDGDSNNSSTTLGPVFGYRFHNDSAMEMGYHNDVGGDDMEIAELNYINWIGDEEEARFDWRPFLIGGVSYFDLDGDKKLKGKATPSWQAQAGIGMSKLFKNNWEFRGDIRYAYMFHDSDVSSNDYAATLTLVHYFRDLPAPAPVPVAEPTPEPEPYVAPVEPEIRVITILLNIEFEFDSAVVRGIYGDELEAVANAMQNHDDIDLVLQGHTDSTGDETYNQELSQLRVDAVKAKLAETYGISADRISAQGYGEDQPIVSNDTIEGRQENRRVIGEMSYSEIVPE